MPFGFVKKVVPTELFAKEAWKGVVISLASSFNQMPNLARMTAEHTSQYTLFTPSMRPTTLGV